MSGPRTIAVVTGTRAEFGLLTPVMRAIAATPSLQLSTIVTGSHLISETWRDVEAADFTIDARVEMQRADEPRTRANDARAVGRGIRGFADVFARTRPEVVLVLGDRIEAFAAASAASIGGFRVAHLHGGDRAEGVADEAMRHAITKLSHLHFPATDASRRRILRMGEDERFVWNVGSPAVDGLDGLAPPRGAAADAPADIIVMQHPIGASDEEECEWARQTMQAVAGHRVLVLAPNHDAGREGVVTGLRGVMNILQNVHQSTQWVEHLPRAEFLRVLAGSRAIVGNSSAGLIEAAALRVPCVNVGPRQAGRERGVNVVDCDYGETNVRAALAAALSLDLSEMTHPYGDGQTGKRIAQLLASIDFEVVPLRKRNAY